MKDETGEVNSGLLSLADNVISELFFFFAKFTHPLMETIIFRRKIKWDFISLLKSEA